jgi:hypothetical protein
MTVAPTDPPAVARPEATSGCNECNESLEAARRALTTARRLALVAENALAGGDQRRAEAALRGLLDDLHDLTMTRGTLDAPPAFASGG